MRRNARQVNVITGKVGVHSVVDVAHVVFDVDLFVEGSLGFDVEVGSTREAVTAIVSDWVLGLGLDDRLELGYGGWKIRN